MVHADRLLRLVGLVLAGCLLQGTVQAQDLEPRSYINVPVGQNFVALVYGYSEGELNAAPSVPLEDANLELQSGVFGYARTLELWGNSAKFDVNVGLQCIKGDGLLDGVHVAAERCGTLDPRVRLAYNFYGGEAMSFAEFVKHRRQGLVVGASLQVGVPLGEYHDDKLINSGANRWFFKPEIGVSNSWGKWSMDAAISAKIFTDNDDFFGDRTLQQDNIYAVQAHLIYSFPKGRWLALDANYYWGGKTRKDGVGGGDLLENSRFGATFTLPLNSQHSLKFLAHTALATTVGNDFETFGIAWQYRWGE